MLLCSMLEINDVVLYVKEHSTALRRSIRLTGTTTVIMLLHTRSWLLSLRPSENVYSFSSSDSLGSDGTNSILLPLWISSTRFSIMVLN